MARAGRTSPLGSSHPDMTELWLGQAFPQPGHPGALTAAALAHTHQETHMLC